MGGGESSGVPRPQPKRRLVVRRIMPTTWEIQVWTDAETAKELAELGSISQLSGHSNYNLTVDPRYDFEEVAAYL